MRTITKVLKTLVYILVLFLSITLVYVYREPIVKKTTSIINNLLRADIVIPEETYNKRNYSYLTVKETDNFIPNSYEDIKNIYYTVLNSGWDSFTFYCPDEYVSCHDDILKIANESDDLEILNYYVSPYNNYKKYNTIISSNGEVYLNIEKLYSSDEISYVNSYVDTALDELNINKNNPTKEDIKKIHDYIIKNVTYDKSYKKEDKTSISNTAFGAITTKKAICSGYTDLFALFMDKLNIVNMKVPSEDHIWNYIYFNNEWLHIDLTWDDDEVNKNNTHNYFMISTKKLLKLDKEKHNFNSEILLELK